MNIILIESHAAAMVRFLATEKAELIHVTGFTERRALL